MSHTGVDVFDFLLIATYPVIGLLLVELVSRKFKAPKWLKLWAQALVAVVFAAAYLSYPGDEKFPLTAAVMAILAIALFYQGRLARISPDKSPY